MAYCANCGAQLQSGTKFCPNCGTPCGMPSSPMPFETAPPQPYRSKVSVPGVLLMVFGAILSVIGVVLWISGRNSNNDMEKQMEYFFNEGRTNPGSNYITGGIVLCCIGFAMLVLGIVLQIARARALRTVPGVPRFAQQPQNTDRTGLAVASLVLGIFSVMFCLPFFSIPAIVFGASGRKSLNASNKKQATAGLILGSVSVGMFVIFIVISTIISIGSMHSIRGNLPG